MQWVYIVQNFCMTPHKYVQNIWFRFFIVPKLKSLDTI